MKLRLQDWFQVSLDDRLSNSVGDRRNSQRPRFSRITLGNVNSTHWRREVRSGAHPIPDSIEIVTQVSVEILDGLSVHPRCPSVRLHLPIRFPHLALRNTKWLGSIHAGLPRSGCPLDKAG